MAPAVRRVLDAHLHMWERDKHAQPWIDPHTMAAIDRDFPPEVAVAELAANGVERCVVVQGVNTAAETVDLLAVAHDTEAVHGVVGWVDLTRDVPRQLDALRGARGGRWLVGTRHVTFVEPDEQWLGRDDVGRGLSQLGRAGLTFDILVSHQQLPLATEVVGRHPTTSFVLDHLGKVPVGSVELETWARHLVVLARLPNVTVKLSGLVTEADWLRWSPDQLRPVVEHLLATFGPERTMFGSDWPLVELAGGYGRWLEAYLELTGDLSAHELAALDRATAERAYGLA